jgi:hypothetical protein
VNRRIPILLVAAAAALSLAPSCSERPHWTHPRNGEVVDTYAFEAQLVLPPDFGSGSPTFTLNGEPVVGVEGPSGIWTVAVEPGPPLRDHNALVAFVPVTNVAGHTHQRRIQSHFSYLPPGKARAFRIKDEDQLLTGPLAHNRLGDYMLRNDRARFVVQGPNKRDLHSVGQYGGDLIDAELLSDPGHDNFFEMTPSVNIETVINATSVVVLNDGQDGTAAIVESCGPDDLLDYINASSQVADFGVELPPGVDDQDYDVTGCTQYTLEPRMPGEPGNRLGVATTITNDGGDPVGVFPGDYLNGMGELEQFTRLDSLYRQVANAGIGELLAIPGLSSFSYFGFGQAEGVSYGRIGLPSADMPPFVDSSFSTSGVSFVLANNSVINLLIPVPHPPSLALDPGESGTFRRVFVVGNGSAGDVVTAQLDLLGEAHGTLRGCVTVGGAPAPGARVTAGDVSGGVIADIQSSWVTDADGCYEGSMPVGSFSVAAEREGTPYEGGGSQPVLHPVAIADGAVVVQDIALPATGRLRVEVTDPADGDAAVPARIGVVGFDPSPEPQILFNFFFASDGGTFKDVSKDPLPYGLTAVKYTGADGIAEFDLEPGSYRVFASRGTEYSLYGEDVTIAANATSEVEAEVTRVLDTTGFISSDYHVHSINSPDSRISLKNRADQFAGEGVENFIATDHDARTDPTPYIQAEHLGAWVKGTVGEEITTFDTGHYNGYPLGVDPVRPSGGSTDWARPAPPGEDFPAYGAYNRSPAEIHAEVLNQLASDGSLLNTSPNVVVQINHIDSHFEPLQIDTAQEPPRSFLDPGEPEIFRLDPSVSNFFHHFPALELWNGSTRGAQSEFVDLRIGIWMNLLNQGLISTFIADTDTHTFLNLRTAGARTWTASPTDDPDEIDPDDVGASVLAGRATSGQGVYVQTRLRQTAVPANEASLAWGGSNTIDTGGDGDVTLVIDVQAPTWAPFDTVEIYANAETFPVKYNDGTPVDYDALATTTLRAGIDFVLPPPTVVLPGLDGAERQDLHLEVPFSLAEDTWFVVVVRGSDGVSEPMFPVFASDLREMGNDNLMDLLDGNLDESGVLALGATNALYADVDGNPGWDPPGVRLVAP